MACSSCCCCCSHWLVYALWYFPHAATILMSTLPPLHDHGPHLPVDYLLNIFSTVVAAFAAMCCFPHAFDLLQLLSLLSQLWPLLGAVLMVKLPPLWLANVVTFAASWLLHFISPLLLGLLKCQCLHCLHCWLAVLLLACCPTALLACCPWCTSPPVDCWRNFNFAVTCVLLSTWLMHLLQLLLPPFAFCFLVLMFCNCRHCHHSLLKLPLLHLAGVVADATGWLLLPFFFLLLHSAGYCNSIATSGFAQ